MPVPNPVFLLVPYRLSTGTNSGSIFSQLPINGTGDFTYTRPGSASFVGSNGNIQFATSHAARILNYYSGSGTCPAFLIEPSAENLCQQSEAWNVSPWAATSGGQGATVSGNVTTSPDGTTNADKLIEAAVTGLHYCLQNLTLTSGTTYTVSLFAKASERTLGRFRMAAATAYWDIDFNLTAGTATGNTTAFIQNYGNGWYRIGGTFTANQASNNFILSLLDASGNTSYTGSGTNGFFVWGAQLETGLVATSYIPTAAASVTRNPDNSTDTSYTLPLPNGTMYTEHFASRTSSYYAHSVGPIPITTGSNRIAVSYTPSKIAVYKNGSFLMSQSIGTYEVGGSIINLGHSSGSYQLNDNLLAFAVYDSELTPADAISLTSGSL